MWQGCTSDTLSLSGCYYVAMDFSGHGLSSHRPAGSPYHFLDYVTDVRRVAAGGWPKEPSRGACAEAAVLVLLLTTSRQQLLPGEELVPFTFQFDVTQ